ncbi:MAG: bifunctional hydroxymethylpyrimidine kinase/phosphomethylpyrimidine kinase, partial [Pseudomonadota bacterium]
FLRGDNSWSTVTSFSLPYTLPSNSLTIFNNHAGYDIFYADSVGNPFLQGYNGTTPVDLLGFNSTGNITLNGNPVNARDPLDFDTMPAEEAFDVLRPMRPVFSEKTADTLAIMRLLVPQATLLMLSQVELGRLAETWREGAEDTMESDVEHLLALGCEFVLVTGTHAGSQQGETAAPNTLANTLFGADGVISHDAWQHMPGPFLGAGGTLSAAITAFMARGSDVPDAVKAAQEYTVGALAHAQRYGMGKFIPNRFFHMQQALPT